MQIAHSLREHIGRYPHGGRHGMLNETNRAEVRANLLPWIGRTLRG